MLTAGDCVREGGRRGNGPPRPRLCCRATVPAPCNRLCVPTLAHARRKVGIANTARLLLAPVSRNAPLFLWMGVLGVMMLRRCACPLLALSRLPSARARCDSALPHQIAIRLYAQTQRARVKNNDVPSVRPRSGLLRSSRNGRPSRMVLSSTVAQSRPPTARPPRKTPDAFDFLNRTEAPAGLERQREQRQARSRSKERQRDHGTRRPTSKSATDPFHALKMQSSLHHVPYGDRSTIKRQIGKYDSFASFPFLQSVQEAVNDALRGLDYRNPTPAQAVAIPALLGMQKTPRSKAVSKKTGPESFLLAAETGSGKTLAYLLPALDAIKREELREKDTAESQVREDADDAAIKTHERRNDIFAVEEPTINKAVDPARPRAIVLLPSAELVAQVGAVAKSLSHVVKFRAAPISAKMTATVIRKQLFNPNGVDMVISTPPLLASIAESNPNILARVTHLVCDEADSLFDRSFQPSTTEIIARAMPSLKKMVFCSATIPKYLDKYLADKYPDIHRLVTPNLHAIPRRVQLGVVDVNKDPYRGNKMLACADTIWQIGKSPGDYDPSEGKEAVPTKRILVFVNEREQTEEVAQYLVKKGIDALAFHRDTDPSRQAKALASFTGSSLSSSPLPQEQPAKPGPATKRTLPNTKVIVTTDLGSRGIDTVAVRHVILYDVPNTTIDFIHRLGRTGRMGRRGRGIVLVGPGDRADIVREVRDAMFRGVALI